MYKKMALELHPDKGGDPEKFQELQEMKDPSFWLVNWCGLLWILGFSLVSLAIWNSCGPT